MLETDNSSHHPDVDRFLGWKKESWYRLTAVAGGVIMLVSVFLPWYIMGRPEVTVNLPAFFEPDEYWNVEKGRFFEVLLLDVAAGIIVLLSVTVHRPRVYGISGTISFLVSLGYGVIVIIRYATMSGCAPEDCSGYPAVGWYVTLLGSALAAICGFLDYRLSAKSHRMARPSS